MLKDGHGDQIEDRYAALRSRLAAFEPVSVLSACGGLQLLPTNGDRLWRLDVLGSLAQGSAHGGQHARHSDVRSFLNEGALASVAAQQEDPYDDVLVEELAFHLGSFRIGGGLAEDGVPVLRLVIRATLLTELLPRPLWRTLCQTTAAALALSDHVLRGAGLERNATPVATADRLAHVPGASRLNALRGLVVFTDDQLRTAARTTDPSCLEPLTAGLGRVFTDTQINAGAPRQPLIHADDLTVLAKPLGIAVALRHHLVTEAVQAVGPAALADAFGAAVDFECRDALSHLTAAVTTTPRSDSRPWTTLESQPDIGLRQVCLVVADPFAAFDPDDAFAGWGAEPTMDMAHAELEQIARQSDDEILGILVGQPAGGSAFLGTHTTDVPNLRRRTIGACDLQSICFLETGDPLALWKWVRADDELGGHTHVLSFSALDSYAVYRDGERSLAAYREATMLTVPPGSGTQLRVQAKRQRDLHGVKFVDGSIREVRRTGEDDWEPAPYHLVDLGAFRRLVLLASEAQTPIWIIGPESRISETWHLVHSVAYWAAEMSTPLLPLLEQLKQAPCVALEVDVDDPDYWWGGGEDPGGETPATYSVDGLIATVSFLAPVARHLAEPTNDADRLICEVLATALNGLAHQVGSPGVSQLVASAAIESVAPRGLKKHLIRLPQTGNETTEQSDGRPREVQEADLSCAREDLASHLRTEGWEESTVIPHDRRDEILKSAVGYLFSRTCAVVDRAASAGLVEYLIGANERLVATTEHRQAILPARLATYPSSSGELLDEVARANQAGICCRFLVEYAAARPPAGTQSWSMREFDTAMAMAAEMLDWAYFDDAVVAGLASADLLINSEGQLRLVELDRYERGRYEFFGGHITAAQTASGDLFPARFADHESEDAGPDDSTLARLDAPFMAEAGLGIRDVVDLMHAASSKTRELEAEVARMPLTDAVEHFAKILEAPTTAVRQAVDYFSLEPRDNFLRPRSGRTRDVLPSRFARRWSYARRPFVKIETSRGIDLVWGRRHPLVAVRVVIGQLLSGRYQDLAEGSALRSELGRLANETGRAFEREISAILAAAGLKTKESVTALGRDSIKKVEGRDLGDIDVLAAQESTKTLWVVECKDLHSALTPGEVVDEMTEHFGDADNTSIARVDARREWVAARVQQALEFFDMAGTPAQWRVRSLMVTGDDVMAPMIKDLPVPVVARQQLGDWIRDRERLASTPARKRRNKRNKGRKR